MGEYYVKETLPPTAQHITSPNADGHFPKWDFPFPQFKDFVDNQMGFNVAKGDIPLVVDLCHLHVDDFERKFYVFPVNGSDCEVVVWQVLNIGILVIRFGGDYKTDARVKP